MHRRSNDPLRVFIVLLTLVTSGLGAAHAQTNPPMPPPSTPQSAGPLAQEFDVVTIKPSDTTVGGMGLARSTPDGIAIVNATAKSLIANAYAIKADLIFGGSGWVGSTEYDVEAKVLPKNGVLPRMNRAQLGILMKAMLADRFKLTVHTEMRQLPVYELTVSKGAPKFHEAVPGNTYADGLQGPEGRTGAGMMRMMNGRFTGQAISISGLVDTLAMELHRTVVDKTGLTGKYDITFVVPREARAGPPQDTEGAGGEAAVPSLFTTLDEELGLKLRAAKGAVATLVIDSIAKPSGN
jgi:uncharacterized protein (TIGR03435 family)